MASYKLSLSLPKNISERQAKTNFFWTPLVADSFVSKVGNFLLGPSLGALGSVPEPNVEFMRLAVAVYAADRTVPRQINGSNWSQREFEITVPVSNPDRWEPVRERLQNLVGFLSGDDWTFEFVKKRSPKEKVSETPSLVKRAVLLSGGADSAVGALLSRHELGPDPHVLISHFGPTFLPHIQSEVARMISECIPGSEQPHMQVHFSRREKQPNGLIFSNEYSTRSRSLLFLALGLAVASIHDVPLWVPENGFASLNPPLGPDRRGSLSTHTTHPLFLEELPIALTEAGVHADLINPFSRMTKGEMFRKAAGLIGSDEASTLLSGTISCANTDQRFRGVSSTTQCGVCFGCIVRRSAFVAAGLKDQTEYLKDIAQPGMADYIRNKSAENSMQIFIERGVRPSDVAALSLPASYPPLEALDLTQRAIAEIKTVL